MQTTNYQELTNYLDHTDEVEVTAEQIASILVMNRFNDPEKHYDFLDVGCSDGRLTRRILKRLDPGLELYLEIGIDAVEPEKEAIRKFKENEGPDTVSFYSKTIQDFFNRRSIPPNEEKYDYIQFAQSWYHFPREDWSFILYGALSLLKEDGLMSIILDSEQGEIYSLKDFITEGRPETLEYGDFVFAEDIQRFLDEREIQYSEFTFPVTLTGNRQDIARSLAFLYRTTPNRILGDFTTAFGKMLARNKTEEGFTIENIVKSFWIRKQ